jgi:hypothetical protein
VASRFGQAAYIQIAEVRHFAQEAQHLKRINFVLFGREAYELYRWELEGQISSRLWTFSDLVEHSKAAQLDLGSILR